MLSNSLTCLRVRKIVVAVNLKPPAFVRLVRQPATPQQLAVRPQFTPPSLSSKIQQLLLPRISTSHSSLNNRAQIFSPHSPLQPTLQVANMATAAAPMTSLLSLLYRSFPRAVPSTSIDLDLQKVSPKIFPSCVYSDAEQVEMDQWLVNIASATDILAKADSTALSEFLTALNKHLATRTTLLGTKPSVADISVYAVLGPVVEKWSADERTGENGYHHIVRYIDFVQNAPLFGLKIPAEEKIEIDVDDVKVVPKVLQTPKEEKEKKKEKKATGQGGAEKSIVVGRGKNNSNSNSQLENGKGKGKEAAEPAATGAVDPPREKKEKKQKQPKQQKQPAAPVAPLSPSLIDLRVGHILRAVNHPNADSLYVSTINCGDAPGTENTSVDEETGLTVRTVCSGLNGLIPLEEMQNRKIVAVCNLKPVTMRGIKSAAMVLAASPKSDDAHAGPVELVRPPVDAQAGERVFFEGWSAGEPEKVLNPKKKIWETFQPGFTTTEALEVAFDSSQVPQLAEKEGEASSTPATVATIGKLVTKSGGLCTVKSLKGATVR
ncbi:acyl-RNA-complex subunit [Histoplasma capsulatum var. duboisii H88]|uniref:Acyl-RNA-complex subunit n=2 Tax=Ajellomyces capsulatus (strain H88) TaxID=544711 RepID=A0A8A1LP32_AJEC8|nr:acyl-RNA-complex subunit [Histoplasma capsulatum var. duboisii H88]